MLGSARAAEIEARVDRLEFEADAGRIAALCRTASATVAPRRSEIAARRSR
jgi:hypothetical protein